MIALKHQPASRLLCALALFTLAGCATQPPATLQILNNDVRADYANHQTAWTRQRTAIIFDGGHSARDCHTYISHLKQSALVETWQNQQLKNEYLSCEVLAMLPTNAIPTNDALVPLNAGKQLLTRLDLTTFASSLARIASPEAYSLNALFPSEVTAHSHTARWQGEDWSLTFEVVAVADINNNQQTDWIIWMADEALESNYRHYATLVVLDPPEQGQMTVTPLSQILEQSVK